MCVVTNGEDMPSALVLRYYRRGLVMVAPDVRPSALSLVQGSQRVSAQCIASATYERVSARPPAREFFNRQPLHALLRAPIGVVLVEQ